MASQVSLSRRACSLSLSFSLFTFRDNHLSRSTNDIVSVKKKNKQTNKTVFPFFLKHSTVVISALRTFGRWWWLRSSTPPLYFSALEMYSYIYIPPLHFDSVLVLPREEKPVIKTKASVSFLRKFVTVVEELHSNFIPMRVCPLVMEHNVWPFGHHEQDCFNHSSRYRDSTLRNPP